MLRGTVYTVINFYSLVPVQDVFLDLLSACTSYLFCLTSACTSDLF